MNKSINNGRLAVQLDDARFCLADLALRGLRISRVEIGGMPVPLIVIDAPYEKPGGLEGGCKRFSSINGRRSKTYAARHCDCQVEWEVPA